MGCWSQEVEGRRALKLQGECKHMSQENLRRKHIVSISPTNPRLAEDQDLEEDKKLRISGEL
ncbi:unnamed protein product [Prunus armeniaca]